MGMDVTLAIVPHDQLYVPKDHDFFKVRDYFIDNRYAQEFPKPTHAKSSKAIEKDSQFVGLKATQKLRDIFLTIMVKEELSFGTSGDMGRMFRSEVAKKIKKGIDSKYVDEIMWDEDALFDLLGKNSIFEAIVAEDNLNGYIRTVELKTWGKWSTGLSKPGKRGFKFSLLNTKPGDKGYFGWAQFCISFPHHSRAGIKGVGYEYYSRVKDMNEVQKLVNDLTDILGTPMKVVANSG